MKRVVTVQINVEAETEAAAERAVEITLQAAGLPRECFNILSEPEMISAIDPTDNIPKRVR